ncbi:MAG: SDR family NAD(P)-dependent oxidoreductase [Helicobacteraceae bacterium]|nr:SDR family NAD(P)-dependent oxidoreductase [Helicobacteraceae bacterium]
MFSLDKRVLNFLVIALLSFVTFWWTFFIFHKPFDTTLVVTIISIRFLASFFIFKDYSLSWSKSTQKTFLLKSVVYISAFALYMPFFYGEVRIAFFASELFFYLFSMTFLMYSYYYFINKSKTVKTKSAVIYGAGDAGIKLEEEFRHSLYKIEFFVDDNIALQKRSIDNISIISKQTLKNRVENKKLDLLVIAIPSAPKIEIQKIYEELSEFFKEIKILPSLDTILRDEEFYSQLKDVTVEDLLARHPKDLDKQSIKKFISSKTILITGAGGSIGSEIARQCASYGASKIILLDHSEFNLYSISEELSAYNISSIMCSVTNLQAFEEVFKNNSIELLIHAAAYKHVPLVEENIKIAIENNIIGTKNSIDLAIKYGIKKFILISTDKAVRPTNVMGTTKRICELYAQNVTSNKTEISAVRFGNVLGSSGSVIPKFRSQIERGGPITVTHKDITRYFMLIPEACELVLQTASIARGKEIFILDMGEPIKIVDLATRMIELSGAKDIEIKFTGLRKGEKLYEELLLDDSEEKTKYGSIMVGATTIYDIDKLNKDIEELVNSSHKLEKLKEIVPEFKHNKL